MKKNLKAIQDKKKDIAEQLVSVDDKNKRYKDKQKPNEATVTFGEESNFQQERYDANEWCETAEPQEIVDRIKAIEKELPLEVLNRKYGVMRGLKNAYFVAIGIIEILENAINELGNHLGGWVDEKQKSDT